MVKPENLTAEMLLRNVVEYLIQTGNQEIGALLVECEMDEQQEAKFFEYDGQGNVEWAGEYTQVILSAPHGIVPKLGASDEDMWFKADRSYYEEQQPTQYSVQQAFEAVLRKKPVLYQTYVQLTTQDESDWRDHLRKLARGELVTNQGRQFKPDEPRFIWNNLNFRSKAERVIAETLDKHDVLFFPNCAARLGTTEYRHTKEPDFLICYNGKWGILQVDGWFHHSQTAAQDQEIDRQFDRYGIRVIQRFTGEQCLKEPDKVVEVFLDRLQRNG